MHPGPNVDGRPASVLIVDDERDNRELLDMILTWEGFAIRTAGSGEEALALLAQHPPHVILLDLMMPGMNGYELTAKIKADPRVREIPIIIVSALTGDDSKRRGQDCGAADFLAKPVDRDQLVARLKTLLCETYPDYQEE
jgi:CheY-like chemotaxis protein